MTERMLVLADTHIDIQRDANIEKVLSCYKREPSGGPVDKVVLSGDISNHGAFLRVLDDAIRTWHDGDIYAVPGNHDCWWAQTPQSWCMQAEHYLGWKTPGMAPYAVHDGLLLFNWWMEPTMLDPPDDIFAYNDPSHYELFECRPGGLMWPAPDMDIGVIKGDITASVSHISPSPAVKSRWQPNWMYVNPKVDELLRAHGSTMHFFGHTHEKVDQTIDGVRYYNDPVGYNNRMSILDLERWVVCT